MRNHDTRRVHTFETVRDFFADNSAILAQSARGQKLLAALIALIQQLKQLFASQQRGHDDAERASQTKAAVRTSIRKRLEAIARTAAVHEADVVGLEKTFRLPHSNGDPSVLTAARAFADAARPIADGFVAHGMPADFLAALDADIAAFEDAIHAQSTARDAHVAAQAAIRKGVKSGMDMLRALNAIVRNQIGDDPVGVAQWRSARHIERHLTGDVAPAPVPKTEIATPSKVS